MAINDSYDYTHTADRACQLLYMSLLYTYVVAMCVCHFNTVSYCAVWFLNAIASVTASCYRCCVSTDCPVFDICCHRALSADIQWLL